jgi:uncharacterized protein YdhG (YjbR/CyaY superfamily)
VALQEIDRYLAALDEPKRSTLEALRKSITEIVPEADQGISYGMPAFKVNGKAVAGFAAFKNHLSYMPHKRVGARNAARRHGSVRDIKGLAEVRHRQAPSQAAGEEAHQRSNAGARLSALIAERLVRRSRHRQECINCT